MNKEAVMYRKILVPIDGSDRSISILSVIRELADSCETEIVLLQVVEYPCGLYSECYDYPTADLGVMKAVQENKKAICQQVKENLDQIAAMIGIEDISVSTELDEGPVVEAILAAAERLDADLIAMAAYGENGTVPWLIGSMANRVLREAKIPVMLFRPASRLEQIRLAYDPVLAIC
jgi:nucleotide-binding universal stress UspA family protein